MSRRVIFSSEVKVRMDWSRRETESEEGDELLEMNPKPHDLSMSRLKPR